VPWNAWEQSTNNGLVKQIEHKLNFNFISLGYNYSMPLFFALLCAKVFALLCAKVFDDCLVWIANK
jgi:hypothetical protein